MPAGVYPRTKEHCKNISIALTGKKLTEEHKLHVALGQTGPKNHNWIGGISLNKKEYLKHYYQINKEKIKNRVKLWVLNNPKKARKNKNKWEKNPKNKKKKSEYFKKYRILNRLHLKAIADIRRTANSVLNKKTIQQVYEDNIKKYGTLTCYLCLKPIEFGNDTLEHNIPVSRGGTSFYDNLAVACKSCNYSKKNKTVEEYKEWLSRSC